MRRRVAVGRATAVVPAALLLLPTVPAAAAPTAVNVGTADAVAAINAACAATQPLAESGLRVTAAGTTVAAYNRTTGIAQQSWDGPGTGLVLTASPAALYREIPLDGASFSKRALKTLGSTATWTVDPSPSIGIADVLPSPGELIRTSLKVPRSALPSATQCASTLLANPRDGFVLAQRTDDAGGTAWRIIAGANYYGRDDDYENGVLMVIYVNPQGIIDRVERGWISSDGLSALGQDLRWEFGVQSAITVPPAASTVDWDRYGAARAAFISSDLDAFARVTARRPLQAATQKALRTRVRNALTLARLDPMFPSEISTTRSRVIVWQKDTTTGTVHAIRFYRLGDGKQIGFKVLVGFTP